MQGEKRVFGRAQSSDVEPTDPTRGHLVGNECAEMHVFCGSTAVPAEEERNCHELVVHYVLDLCAGVEMLVGRPGSA